MGTSLFTANSCRGLLDAGNNDMEIGGVLLDVID